MEHWDVIGFRKVEFADKQTGSPVKGYSLYLTRPAENKYIVGSEALKLFVGENIGYVPAVGDQIAITYNRYGKPQDIVRL